MGLCSGFKNVWMGENLRLSILVNFQEERKLSVIGEQVAVTHISWEKRMFGTLWVVLWPCFILSHLITASEWPCLLLMFSMMVLDPTGDNIASLWAPSKQLTALSLAVSDQFLDVTLMVISHLGWFNQFTCFCFQCFRFLLIFEWRKKSVRHNEMFPFSR